MLPPPHDNMSALTGGRRGGHTHDRVGTLCEPWLVRHAITALDQLLEPHHRGLEWSSGSSTLWNLVRLAGLHTVEHEKEWLAAVRAKVSLLPANVARRWTVVHVPCVELRRGGCKGLAVHNPFAPQNSYNDYVATPRRRLLPHILVAEPAFPGWDYVVVDGRSRAACMREATSDDTVLLNRAHGLLVLDNADAPFHVVNVSADWLGVSFRNDVQRTDVWMVCSPSQAGCRQARRELRQMLSPCPRKGSRQLGGPVCYLGPSPKRRTT